MLLKKTDKEIYDIALPIINDVIEGSMSLDWERFSKYQTQEEANDPNNRKHVESYWKENNLTKIIGSTAEFKGLIRRNDKAIIYWQQETTLGECLAIYTLKEIDNEIKELGFILQ